ncbi:MAG: response regulator [Hungatella sp.]
MYRLLIADDEMIERKALYKTLEKALGDQCMIFQAENGREALRIYEEEQIQIALLDIEMPGINGIEAAQRIREQDPDCCIIFLTAFDEFPYAKKAITVRALDYLLKPYDEQELLLVLEEAMRITQACLQKESAQPPLDHSDKPEMILQYIHEHYMQDISMQDLARAMNYSEAYFCKLFKQNFHQNFTFYLTEYRIQEAKKLLEDPMINIKEIGRAVGYSDSNYFAKVFKRITGQSPTEYRNDIFKRN